MPAQSPSFIARGDIPPSVFVKQNGTDHGIVVCVANDEAIGVSHEGTREAPISGITPLAAKNGESCQVYTDTWSCEIIAGAAIVAGNKLKPDINGHAVPVVGDALGAAGAVDKIYSAIARSSAAIGERVKCTVQRGIVPVS